jgi:beta-galactosidase
LTPYVHDFLKLEISGPGDIIGPTELPLIGGCIAVWVKTRQAAGRITVSAKSLRMQANDVVIEVN